MTSLKFDITEVEEIRHLLKEGNKVIRISYNLYKKRGMDLTNCIKYIQKNYSISDILDQSLIKFFCQQSYGVFKQTNSRNTVIFGGKNNWKKYQRGKISLTEFNNIKNTKDLLFVGSKHDYKGNRKIELDIKNSRIKLKINRQKHVNIHLNIRDKRLKILEKLEHLSENRELPLSYKIGRNSIKIIFDETILKEREHKFIENRIASLDLNPNYIGFVIKDFSSDEIIYKSVYNLTKLNNTHNKNKKDYEIIEIAKSISTLCVHYQVECVGLEKLTISPKNHGKGKKLNRLLNNTWNRNKFINNLKKRLNILGIKNQEIVCAYSSTVGCLDYPEETDSIAAALEIGRRTYVFLNRFIKKRKEFSDVDVMYPKINRGLIKERWNSILSNYNPKNIGYRGIHEYLKKEKKLMLIRFLFKDYDFSSWSCLRHKSSKSLIFLNCSCYYQKQQKRWCVSSSISSDDGS